MRHDDDHRPSHVLSSITMLVCVRVCVCASVGALFNICARVCICKYIMYGSYGDEYIDDDDDNDEFDARRLLFAILLRE